MSEPISMYEFAYIVDGVLSEERIKDMVRRVSKFISDNDGKIIFVDEQGTQRLSYPIQKKNNGYYVYTYFEGPSSLVARLERAAQINESILRFLTLKYDAKMRRHYEKQVIEQAQAAAEAAEAAEAES